jgi:hypothetical protein
MSNRRKPTGPAINRRGPLTTREFVWTRRQKKAYRRSWRVLELRCIWDIRLGRTNGCHVKQRAYWANCAAHPTQTPNHSGRAA